MPVNTRFFVNPLDFKTEEMPIIVLCDDLRSFIGWGIRSHTKGNWNHAFIMNKKGKCVSQNFDGFNQYPIDVYLKDGMMLKFWSVKNMDVLDRLVVIKAIERRLLAPWWKNMYDFFGVAVGQLFNIRWAQNPFKMYCSEQVKADFLDKLYKLGGIDFGRPSPSDLDNIFKAHPDKFICRGYWWDC